MMHPAHVHFAALCQKQIQCFFFLPGNSFFSVPLIRSLPVTIIVVVSVSKCYLKIKRTTVERTVKYMQCYLLLFSYSFTRLSVSVVLGMSFRLYYYLHIDVYTCIHYLHVKLYVVYYRLFFVLVSCVLEVRNCHTVSSFLPNILQGVCWAVNRT